MNNVEDALTREVQETSLAILTNAILATPVGDPSLWQNPGAAPPGYAGGHARRNWQVSIGGPGSVEVGGIDPSGQSAIALGQAELQLVDGGDTLYLEHTVPYSGRLNFEGWSIQAPVNYVGDAIDTALSGRQGRREVL